MRRAGEIIGKGMTIAGGQNGTAVDGGLPKRRGKRQDPRGDFDGVAWRTAWQVVDETMRPW